jgi:hypothetical protein
MNDRFTLLVGLLLGLGASPLPSQVPTIDDDFQSADPCGNGWICQGTATWIDSPEGCVRLTSTGSWENGNLFLPDRILWDDFLLTAEFEINGGGMPADGMAIVFVGSDAIPGLGQAGGGMGATGLGNFPTMLVEFDTWNNSPADTSSNHVGFSYTHLRQLGNLKHCEIRTYG